MAGFPTSMIHPGLIIQQIIKLVDIQLRSLTSVKLGQGPHASFLSTCERNERVFKCVQSLTEIVLVTLVSD